MTNINNRQINQHQAPASSTRSNARSSTSTSQACAACRYQRRKCAPDCILAPYFPHDRQRQFQNAHKLFGVSNITKIIRDLDPTHKDEAMRTIIYQSDVRAHDPVGGCYRIITDLHRQIQFSTAQLHLVLHHLALCRTHAQNQNQHQIFTHATVGHSDINLYDHADIDLDLDVVVDTDQQQQQHQHHDHDDDDDDQGHVALQDMNSWTNMNNSPPSSDLKPPLDDFKPLLINDIPAGERQKHHFKFDFDEPSEETLFSDANHKASTKEENVTFFTKEENVPYQQHNEDNDLKGAATLFTLTNCSSY